ncbi:hypothetical protein AQUCO_02600152v1 [Aquilegia coerulea]|uniref:Uncharacterized protein n=1 Tax=Aquilegia coerulea TaxID=218851 RepID=A0A2G5D7L2_AQUCA|nr:hypothetical protein AQUCO_02600152v1 [Aquilegia coerulea]
MEEEEEQDNNFINAFSHSSPSLISLANFSPSIKTSSSRRLSSQFNEPTRPINSDRRLSWVSLEGRLIGAEEATSAKTIKGNLGLNEIIAWDLFTPIHRVLIVAIIAVATNDLKKSRQISSLKRSVDLRDQVLSSMQQKLDSLCDQVNTMKERPENGEEFLFVKSDEFEFSNDIQSKGRKLSSCGCCFCEAHQFLPNAMGSFEKTSGGDEPFKFKMPHTYIAEQEERRMSDFSDWASSVTSAADNQLNALGIEQDIYNLQRECEEKDATIKELSAAVRATDVAGSKRIAELEDVIRRKNMIITKLKKDMVVLEQKVVHLVRLRRPSSVSTVNTQELPFMADNVLYDMDSTTSPSSSDSDSEFKNRPPLSGPHEHHIISSNENDSAARSQRATSVKASVSSPRKADRDRKQQPISPLKEKSMNQRPTSTVTLRPKHVVSTHADMKRTRRRSLGSKEATPLKRWA